MSQLNLAAVPTMGYSSASSKREAEDFIMILKRWRPAETPLLAMSGTGPKLKNYETSWSVDSWDTPKGAVGVPDNEPTSTAELRNNMKNIRRMGNIGQAFRRAYGLGWIQEKVAQVPGNANTIAKAAADQLLILKQEIEGAISSFDQVAASATTTTGSIMTGLGKMADRTNTYDDSDPTAGLTLGKTPATFAPSADQCVDGVDLGSLNYGLLQKILLSLRKATKRKAGYLYLCGLELRQAITNALVMPTAQATTAQAVANKIWAFQQAINDSEIGASITRITTDFGQLDILDSDWVGKTMVDVNGAAATQLLPGTTTRVVYPLFKLGYITLRDNFELRWGVEPETGKYADNGAGNHEWVRAFAALCSYHPQGIAYTNFS